jgi:hypothetical protein
MPDQVEHSDACPPRQRQQHQRQGKSLLQLDGATCLHHDGDTEEACNRAVAALSVLPDAYRTGLVHRRAMDLYEAILGPRHAEPAVRELGDLLAA